MLFHEGGSAFHRASPLTRLAVIAAIAAMLPLWPSAVLLGALLLCVAGGFALGFGRVLLWRLALLMVPVGLALAVVHGLLIERSAAVPWGPLTVYPDGLSYGLLVFLRLSLLLAICLIFVMTTGRATLPARLTAPGCRPQRPIC